MGEYFVQAHVVAVDHEGVYRVVAGTCEMNITFIYHTRHCRYLGTASRSEILFFFAPESLLVILLLADPYFDEKSDRYPAAALVAFLWNVKGAVPL